MRTKKEINQRIDEYRSIVSDLNRNATGKKPNTYKIQLYTNQIYLLDWVLGTTPKPIITRICDICGKELTTRFVHTGNLYWCIEHTKEEVNNYHIGKEV